MTTIPINIAQFQALVQKKFGHSRLTPGSKCAIVGLVALLAASAAWGQNVDTGRITGEAQDSSGGLINAAQVSLKNTGTGQTIQTVTGSSGLFVSQPLAPGYYEVEAPRLQH